MSLSYDTLLITIQVLMPMALTVSGFLVAASSFLMGLFLNRVKAHALEDELKPFLILIPLLLVLPIALMAIMFMVVLGAELALFLKFYFFLLTLSPLVASIGIIGLLFWKRRRY